VGCHRDVAVLRCPRLSLRWPHHLETRAFLPRRCHQCKYPILIGLSLAGESEMLDGKKLLQVDKKPSSYCQLDPRENDVSLVPQRELVCVVWSSRNDGWSWNCCEKSETPFGITLSGRNNTLGSQRIESFMKLEQCHCVNNS